MQEQLPEKENSAADVENLIKLSECNPSYFVTFTVNEDFGIIQEKNVSKFVTVTYVGWVCLPD